MFADLLRRKLEGIVRLSLPQIEILARHFEMLLRWNRALNLTTITAMEEAVERHYCESLFLGAHLPEEALRLVDIGSGAGFPGIPVAVLRPDCTVTLIESHVRKGVFLREATRGLKNVVVRAERAESVKDRFDHALCRAVSYDDLVPILKNICLGAELLTGGEAPPERLGFNWVEPILLPWGRQRYLRSGVSRETY